MTALVAPCGFRCDRCPAFEGSGIDRVRTSAAWSAIWGIDVPPEQVRCHGCHAGCAPGAALPEPGCAVRGCARGRKLTGCAACAEVPCALLERRLASVERVAEAWRGRLSSEAWDRFIAPFADARRTLAALRARATGRPAGRSGGSPARRRRRR